MTAQISESIVPKKESGSEERPYSERIARLRENFLSSPYEADIERARYYTRSYMQTENDPPCLRAAKGLTETLLNMSIKIEDDERLVGAKTFRKIAGPIGIERSSKSMVALISTNFHGKNVEDIGFLDKAGNQNPEFLKSLLSMPEEMHRELTEEILPYWKGKDIRTRMIDSWKTAGLYKDNEPDASPVEIADMQGHVTAGLRRVLSLGFKGIAAMATQQLSKLNEGDENYGQRKDFLESIPVAAKAVGDHARRYAELAEEMAREALEPRKSELLAVAERCRRVPAEPPRNFWEALQSIWMTQALLVMSYGEDSIICPGRVDQFLHPYYKNDLEAGLVTYEEALEAIEEYFIKLSTFISFGPNNVTIGGLTREGQNAVNEVSYLMLEAHRRLKGLRNGLAVRFSNKTPRDFLAKAGETHRYTAGVAFYNDAVVVRDLVKDGYALEDARDYSIVGCVEPTGTGNNSGYTAGSGIRLSVILEMALNEGRAFSYRWKQLGIKTPSASELKTFEEVKQAFADQLSYSMDLMAKKTRIKDQIFAEAFPAPLLSSTIEGCLESGQDITRGGAFYNHGSVSARGVATVANSLAAIRWAVFEEKLITLGALVEHLRKNFEGAELLRQQLIHKAPKYGNADPAVDELALWIVELYSREARRHQRFLGGVYRTLLVASGTQLYEGRDCWATPDGRLARQPVSNGISPSNGTERKGMTAAMHSVAGVCFPNMSNGCGFNMNLNPLTIRTDEGLDKFTSLIEGFFELGGRQVQFNPFSRETLRDAQKNPKNYPDLMVKVSGYSFRFIDLSKALQNDIIERTEFNL
jgi:pyruvate formate-lyase/glycerol dehydratase family glycyl radical enzyme